PAQDLGEIAAGLMLDVHGGLKERQVIVAHPGTKGVHRRGPLATAHDLIFDKAAFGYYPLRHLTGEEAKRDSEWMSSTQAARHYVQRIGELLAECGDSAPAGQYQEHIERSDREQPRKRDRNKI